MEIITLKIERQSTLNKNYRCSPTVKVGKHEWSLAAGMVNFHGEKYLGIRTLCNYNIPESTWLCELTGSTWIEKEREKFYVDVFATTLKCNCTSFYSCVDPHFIPLSEIPEYIVDDTLTLKFEVQLHKNVYPSVSFGEPNDCQVASYETIIEEQVNSNFFNNEVFADVVFVVGPKKVSIFGHRLVIAMSCPVFAVMLFPKTADCLTVKYDKENRLLIEIQDPETHPTALQTLFRFIYKKQVVVDPQLIEETLYVGEKYFVRNFVESFGFLVTPETVLHFLPFVSDVGERHVLYNRCKWIMDTQIKSVIKTDAFLEIGEETLKTVLTSDLLEIRELDLFDAYVKWADQKCKNQNMTVNDENRRKVMNHLNLIRFPIMSLEEFAAGPAQTDILTGDEKSSIFCYMIGKFPTEFPIELRNF